MQTEMTKHKQTKEALEERLKFETLLANLSARFINLPPDQIDSEIVDAQRQICECLDIDRSTLWQIPEDEPGKMLLTHWHQPPGSLPPPEGMNAEEFFPWSTQKVLNGEVVTFSKPSDLPPAAGLDKENFSVYGTQADVLVPLSSGKGPVFGLLTFAVMHEERIWTETVVTGFTLIAHVFAGALDRKRSDEMLHKSEARLSLVTEAVGAGLWIMEVDTGRVWGSPKIRELFHFAPDEELCYESFFKVIHADDRELVHHEVQNSLQSGENFSCDYRIVLPDGNTRWIVSRGQRYVKAPGEPERLLGLSLDITERKRGEQALEERLRFETLLSEISARFVNQPADGIDREIEDTLSRLCELFGIDLAAVWQWLPGSAPGFVTLTHFYRADEGPRLAEQIIAQEYFPWCQQQVRAGHIVKVSSMDELPPEAARDLEMCRNLGVKSNLTIPLSVGGAQPIGAFGLNSTLEERTWQEEIVKQLQLVAQVFANALDRKRTDEELRRHEKELSSLTGRIINAQEEELRLLSRELHDDLTQRLAALSLDAALIERQFGPVQPQAVQALKDLRAGLTDVAEDVHNLSRQLHPSILDDLGLVQAVQAECDAFNKKTGINVSFEPADLPDLISQDLSLCLYRIIQESLQNIAKHAQAAAASITLQGFSGGINLLIRDNGIGFDPSKAKQKAGIGLSSMRERVRIVNGTLAIASEPGKGSEIQIFIPLGELHDQAKAADS